MKKTFKYLMIILLFQNTSDLFSQNQKLIDSLVFSIKYSPDDTSKVNTLLFIGDEYNDGNPKIAVLYYKQALQVAQKINNEIIISKSLEYLGLAYRYGLAKYDSASIYLSECTRIRKRIFGDKNLAYASAVGNLAGVYRAMGNYDKARPLYVEAVEIQKAIVGEKHIDYASAINNLALFYKTTGDYELALPLYKKAAEIRQVELGENHKLYAQSLNNLAMLHHAMANYSLAEPLYFKAIDIWKKSQGQKHLNMALAYNNLGGFYEEIGNYEAAEPLYIEAINIRREILGEKHPDYAQSLNNLALLYQSQGRHFEAEPLFKNSLEIRKEILGEKHPDYAQSLNNLALHYSHIKNFNESERLYLQALSIREAIFGKKHPDYANSLNNLAKLYYKIENYKKSKELFVETINLRKEILGINHPQYINSLFHLALLYQKTNEFLNAETTYVLMCNLTIDNIIRAFSFMSEREKELYLLEESASFSNFYAFALQRQEENPAITQLVYNYVIKNKALLLKSSTAMRVAILNSGDSILISKYNEWISLRKKIDKLYQTEINKRKISLEELEKQANLLEKDLVKNSQELSDFENTQKITWENIRENLKKNEAAIEFLQFEVKKDSTIYCALIIKNNYLYPKMVKLCNESDLEIAINKISNNDDSNVNHIYGTKQNLKNQLYQLIWQPLDSLLKDVKTIYYSPDGLLHRISFAAISKKQNVFLCDNFQLKQQTSTVKILFPEMNLIENNFATTIYGGIDYSTDTTNYEIWEYLNGTKVESEALTKILNSKNISTLYSFGSDAQELKFKQTAEKYQILHIATHGFFYPNPEEQKTEKEKKLVLMQLANVNRSNGFGVWQFAKNKNPLMRSGIVFAGANNVWNQRFPSEGEDGVLTANEVSQLNLQNTQLVILSACETGLGDIKGSEGVYGLQRAFKMAGVKYIIMSLWQVPDKETVEFMTTFYTKLLKQKDIRKAFTETQKIMQKKYDPYYWAAFVLIE